MANKNCMDFVLNNCEDVFSVLEDWGWNYDRYVVKGILEDSFTRKEHLYNLLSHYPTFNKERGYLTLQFKEGREFDTNQMWRFKWWLSDTIRDTIGAEEARKAYEILQLLENFRSQFLKDTKSYWYYIEHLNEYGDYRIRPEMKLSKVISKIARLEGWDKLEGYEREYAKLSNALNPLLKEVTMVISMNPCDYLLMSNGNSWQSCHNIDNRDGDPGCYCAGTLSYLEDENSLIVYTITEDEYGEDRLFLNEKYSRQVWAFDGEMLLQSRLYPQDLDRDANGIYRQYYEAVMKVISDCLKANGENRRFKKIEGDVQDHVRQGHGACNYPDWQAYCPGSENVNFWVLEGVDLDTRMLICGHVPHCILTGDEINNENSLVNVENYYCDCCGDVFHDEDELTCVYGGEMVCQYCLDRHYVYCEDVDMYVHEADAYYVEEYDAWYSPEQKGEEFDYCETDGCYHTYDVMKEKFGRWYLEDDPIVADVV